MFAGSLLALNLVWCCRVSLQTLLGSNMLMRDTFTSKFILRPKMPSVIPKSLYSVVFLGKGKRIKENQEKPINNFWNWTPGAAIWAVIHLSSSTRNPLWRWSEECLVEYVKRVVVKYASQIYTKSTQIGTTPCGFPKRQVKKNKPKKCKTWLNNDFERCSVKKKKQKNEQVKDPNN